MRTFPFKLPEPMYHMVGHFTEVIYFNLNQVIEMYKHLNIVKVPAVNVNDKG